MSSQAHGTHRAKGNSKLMLYHDIDKETPSRDFTSRDTSGIGDQKPVPRDCGAREGPETSLGKKVGTGISFAVGYTGVV